jgi:hypothetical protein
MSQEPSHIDAAIADLEVWLERISTAIETLRHLQSQGGALPDSPVPIGAGRASLNGDIPHDAFFQMTVPDAAEKYLTLTKKTKPTSELANALLKGGLKSAAKNFPSMLNTILSRESRFVKVNKEWALTAWYPGMRRGTRTATTETSLPSKPSGGLRKKQPKGEHKTKGFSPDSLKGRTLSLLNSKPSELFSAAGIAEALGADHKPSVAAALSGLLADHLIARPQKGQYQALKTHPITVMN